MPRFSGELWTDAGVTGKVNTRCVQQRVILAKTMKTPGWRSAKRWQSAKKSPNQEGPEGEVGNGINRTSYVL